jgi:hypothetical protein
MPPDIDCTVKWMPQSAIQRYEINLPMRERKAIFATPILRYRPPGVPELRIDSTIKALSQISEVHVYSTTSLDMAAEELARTFYQRYAKKVCLVPSSL